MQAELLRGGISAASNWLQAEAQVGASVADAIVRYLARFAHRAGHFAHAQRLGVRALLDDSGGMQLVLHSPYGGRINRGLGLLLAEALLSLVRFRAASGRQR